MGEAFRPCACTISSIQPTLRNFAWGAAIFTSCENSRQKFLKELQEFRPRHRSAQCSSPLRVFKFAFFLCPLGLVFGFTISTHLNGVGSHVFWMVVMEFMWCGGRSHYCRSFSFFDPHLLPYHFDPVWCCCRSETRGSDLTFGCLSVLLFFRREWWVGVDPEVWCGFGVAVGSFIWSGSGCRRF
ncbi:hypothetical protein TSUD_86860 [Trifolium subterraneum]|uniref:Uncharacterized protein n=1 Tax=Trifolium subterraneum TaxID=3900 RepID=A0A2Z6NU94_TRISU|nr:hypothetical protein TSUD_86860 [Trifolium subterraneum]